ncbi:pilus (MSHA type) biogenesis protein MshL [Pseudidiomarina sediminum]|uniref:Pilus (MSHA type) biogenesis protein MshL n=1 Tax=Pseudidiomarina sediminum TaxID=431675 RepID=A0A432Z9W2_9GAMM|nr:pilus (MSHA type) biogenesis protein MshL [Pseudidiomarina sediminum]MBY6063945.1 pilus (MSHA type) biogenesis protein MshL [Pseudidiomarina sediminum]RUO74746.1 pilus (MSHA type) biogenesis protein MshL [Pseudidiomarina sediminum]
MRVAMLCAAAVVLTACAHQPDRKPVEAQQALQQTPSSASSERPPLPASVRETLRPNALATTQASEQLLAEPRFSVNANGIAAADFFAGLAADSPYNIVVHPEVSGAITVSLKEVTLSETLAVVSDIYGYDIRRDNRMIRVFPAGLRTETIALDYLALQRLGLSQTSVSSGGVRENDRENNLNGNSNSYNNGLLGNQAGLAGQGNLSRSGYNGFNNGMQTNGSSISTQSETDLWSDLQEIVTGVVGEGEGRRVVVSPQAGLVTITAHPHELRAAREFLASAQERLQRQVILEARIVEVALNDDYQQGISWGDLFSLGNASGSIGFGGGSVANNNGVFGVSLDVGDFSGVLNLLQDQGNVQVLSNPRVSAANNQKAVIKIGEDEYFVTDVSTTTVTGTATTSTPNIELTPFFSGISLDITPQISDNGDVVLHVHPSVVETTEQSKTITLNEESFVLPLAQSNIRESDTIVRARNGEIVVLGGLMQTSYTDAESKAPVLGDIPVLGNLFKNKRRTEQKKELVILIRPVVVGVDTWQQELERSSHLLKQWYDE